MNIFSSAIVVLVGTLLLCGLAAGILGISRGNIPLTKVVVWVAVVTAALVTIATLAELSQLLLANQVTVAVPLETFQPKAAPGIELHGFAATIVSGGVDRATLTIANLTWPPRLFLAASSLLRGAVMLSVCLLAVRLARSLQAGAIFSSGTNAILVVAAIVGSCGFFGSVFGDIGAWQSGVEALQWHGAAFDSKQIAAFAEDVPENLAQYGWPAPGAFRVDLPAWPLTASLGLALVGAVFKAGGRLRRDTEGLI